VIALTLGEIAEIVGGRLHRADGGETVTGTVEFDSRKVVAGGMFAAVPGEHVDGHDFAATAVASGAVAVLAAHEVPAPAVIVPPAGAGGSGALALAGDTTGEGAAVLAALARLARAVLDRLPDLTVVGVTGSAGKTSTKDLLAQVIGPLGETVAAPGSFNNELGLPWTVLRCDERTRYLVLELSARGTGHIAALCEIAPPSIGVVLNVGTAHLGEFGSRENIAVAKGELVEALPPAERGGLAVLNADDELVAAMAGRTAARVVRVGKHNTPALDVAAGEVALDERARPSFLLRAGTVEARVTLGLYGAHHVNNALAAAAVALHLGATPDSVAASLSEARRVSARRMDVSTRGDGVTVVNDAYNASPESMRAALKTLVSMAGEGRSWAVLAGMGELGADSARTHDEIGRLAVRLNVTRLVAVGEDAAAIHRAANLEGSWGEESVLVPDVDAAMAVLRAELRPSDVVLVKGANAHGLWRLADALLAESSGGRG
jgi:UDP-N-acetylmuramoyl-tripeptide--D-alanyl-D-alanine ligase